MNADQETYRVEIVEYRADLRPHFERLNRLWLEDHALLEPLDLEYLQDPERLILSGGGQVFFAMQGSTVLGTCAAIRMSSTTFELAKLSVEPATRGQGLGRRLCETVIRYARQNGATEVVLTSNSALVEAIALYESMGFQHAPLPADMPYATADVYMRLTIG